LQKMPCVLLVDDENAALEGLRDIFEALSFNVFTAENGLEALALLRSETVDAVVTDLVMPEMDGFELLTLVSDLYPQIPVYLTTAFADNDHLLSPNAALAAGIFSNPVNIAKLIDDIKKSSTN